MLTIQLGLPRSIPLLDDSSIIIQFVDQFSQAVIYQSGKQSLMKMAQTETPVG